MQDTGFEGVRSDYISKNANLLTSPVPAVTSIGASMRQWRRSIGITQAQLAEIIGVTQGLVSRWESGHEMLPKRQLDCLYGLMRNKNRTLDPMIKRFLRGNSMYGVLAGDTNTLFTLSDSFLHRLQLSRADVEGKQYVSVFNHEWRNTSTFQNADRTNMCYWKYDRDVMLAEKLAASQESRFRQHFKMAGCYMEFEGHDEVLIVWVNKIEAPKFEVAPRIHRILKYSDVFERPCQY